MRLLTTILAVAGAAAAQAAVTPFGAGCPFENQVPAIGNVGLPQLGQTFDLTYSGPNYTYNSAQQIAHPHLALGLQQQTTPIPAGLLLYQPAGCAGYLVPLALTPMPPDPALPQYESSFRMAIPSDPGLIGAQLLAQWLLLHTQCGFSGCGLSAAITSDAALITIGP